MSKKVRVTTEFENSDDARAYCDYVQKHKDVIVFYDPWLDSVVDTAPAKIVEEKTVARTDYPSLREALMSQIADLNRQLESIPARPAEPGRDFIDGVHPATPLVVRFVIDFGKGQGVYHFAAIRTRGKWYTTGHVGPQGVTWNRLWKWIEERGGLVEDTSVDLAGKWTALER